MYFVFSRWRCKDLEEVPLVGKSSHSLHVRKPNLKLILFQGDSLENEARCKGRTCNILEIWGRILNN